MDYSKELLQKIEEEARRMMTPAEISALLDIDETELTDDINTLGHPARWAFFHGVAITAREIREDVLMPYSQTYGSFNLPVEAFELLAWGNPVGIVLNNNPINAYCLCNCVIDEDRLENKKPIKVSQFRKIDGAITLLMTLGLMCTYER